MLLILSLFNLLLVLATFLPLLKVTHWTIRGLDFPRVQFLVVGCVLLVVDCLLLDFNASYSLVITVLSALCVAWQCHWVLPYTPLWRKEVKATNRTASTNSVDKSGKAIQSDQEISILTSNVLTPNRNAKALVDLVMQYKPDVLVTLESDQWWEQQLEVIEKEMPNTVKVPQDNLYGMHVYSRLPLIKTEVCYLVEEDVPSIHATIVIPSGEEVEVHFLHPCPPSPTENDESAERDAELLMVAKSVANTAHPVIVTGDLNDVAWSPTTTLFRKISGLLDPRIGRGTFNTFNAKIPFIRWPLDHLFHSSHFTLKEIQRLPSIDSDHFPLFARLCCESVKPQAHNGQSPSQEEKQEASRIVSKESVSKTDVPDK